MYNVSAWWQQIATRNNITRIKRCGQIMGRAESDSLTAAQIFYPCMQYVTDAVTHSLQHTSEQTRRTAA